MRVNMKNLCLSIHAICDNILSTLTGFSVEDGPAERGNLSEAIGSESAIDTELDMQAATHSSLNNQNWKRRTRKLRHHQEHWFSPSGPSPYTATTQQFRSR